MQYRRLIKASVAHKYKKRIDSRLSLAKRKQEAALVNEEDDTEDVFQTQL